MLRLMFTLGKLPVKIFPTARADRTTATECPENNYRDNTPGPEVSLSPVTMKVDGARALLV